MKTSVSSSRFLSIKDSRGKEIARSLETPAVKILIGSRNLNQLSLAQSAGIGDLRFLSQVHSPTIVEQTTQPYETPPTADGHYTSTPDLGLCIVTADCLPVVIWSESHPIVAAVHAGWRGVASGIVTNAVRLISMRVGQDNLRAFIGPHIQATHFEVHQDVASQIARAHPLADRHFRSHPDPAKVFINLARIVALQLAEFGVRESQVEVDSRNTLTDLELASFRRDGKNCGRNICMITLKSR